MASRPRAALAALALLPLLALAACAPEPEPQLTLPPSPSAEPTAAAPTLPGSRVPVTCDELVSNLDSLTVTSVASAAADTFFAPEFAQSGFEYCTVQGSLGGSDAELSMVVGVEIPPQEVQVSIDYFAAEGLPTNFAGDLSWTSCKATQLPGYCLTEVLVNGYLVEFSTSVVTDPAADFDDSVEAVAISLAESMSQWPAPVAAWERPADALAWSSDCENEVAATDAPIRDALDFDVAPAYQQASGDGFRLVQIARDRQGVTGCAWEGSGASLFISIVPGAAWLADKGVPLEGDPFTYPGAVTATIDDQYSPQVTISAIVEGSLVAVTISPLDREQGTERTATEVVRVLDAIVANFSE